jgi:CBS domain-containing protein
MIKHNVSSLLILENDELIGIISHQDIVYNFGENKKVHEVMTKNVITISPNDSVDDAVEILVKKRVSLLPVVDSNKKLIGMIHAKDILASGLEGEDFLMD